MAHLMHKINWASIVEYYTPYKDKGIRLPVGECGKVHLIDKKTRLKVQNRGYLKPLVCTDKDCVSSGIKIFRKNNRKKEIFCEKPVGNELLFDEFKDSLVQTLHEFALTELNTSRHAVYQPEQIDRNELTSCNSCDNFITLLEFGDKEKLFALGDTELQRILSCTHGGQAVGVNLSFLFYHVLRVYVYTNIILYANLEESNWPRDMKPKSYFWNSLLYACDGQTFLPHSRKFLKTYMKDFNDTHELCKRLFRFMYFYVMVEMKVGRDWRRHIWF